jgi:hypothetical protein
MVKLRYNHTSATVKCAIYACISRGFEQFAANLKSVIVSKLQNKDENATLQL